MTGLSLCARAAALAALLLTTPALAQNQGFQLNRYEPTSAGEFSFAVDHPWYSATRYFAAGITLNYAHNPLVLGQQLRDGSFVGTDPLIEHQLLGHVDLAGSFLDRVTLSLSLPILLYESGTAQDGVTPISGVSVSDPRLGVMVRLWGQPDRSPFSISVGGQLWVPLRKLTDSLPQHTSDQEVRGLPKVVLAGLGSHIRWSFTTGVLIRPDAILGTPVVPDGSSTGTSLQLGALIQYADVQRRFAVGPEALLDTVVTDGRAFKPDYTSLELLLGVHYNVAKQVQLALAGGVGLLREPGTPDGRLLLRAAYAPIRGPRVERPRDDDKDGIPDREDACPTQSGVPTADPRTNGCPPSSSDADGDGVPDAQDLCPNEAAGTSPDPQRPGCPVGDSDGDGVFDAKDLCPRVAAGPQPDPQRPGCPASDRDGDGILDAQDLCPDAPAGARPDPKRPGCAAMDSDGDGVIDGEDRCPREAAGLLPDPQRPGCPLPDKDGDGIADKDDACPQKAGAPDADARKNGCPGLIEIKDGFIQLFRQIYFKTGSAVIHEERSQHILRAVLYVLKTRPELKKIEVVGRADDKGAAEGNLVRSQKRAESVMTWLVDHGIAAERLQAKGYGEVALVQGESVHKQRTRNRRVEFQILDPPLAAPAPVSKPAAEGDKAESAQQGKSKQEPHKRSHSHHHQR